MGLSVNGVSQATADAAELDGITADLQPVAGKAGYAVVLNPGETALELAAVASGAPTGSGVVEVVSGAFTTPARTLATVLNGILATRGDVFRRGATTTEALNAKSADTFLGGDGTDVGVRSAAQVKTSLGLGAVIATGADAAAARSAISAETAGAAAAAQAAAIATASADATTKANAAQAAAAAYTDGVSAGTEGVAADYTDSVAVVTLASAASDATTKANAAQAAAIAAAAADATTKANAAVVSATAAAASDATTKANAAAAASLAKTGGTMSGAIAMGSSKITGLGQATAASEALAAPVGISNGSLLYWISGTLGALAPGSPYMIPRIAAAGSAIEWVAGSTALGVVPSLIPLCDYAVCAGPLTAVGRLRFDPGAWTKAATGYTTVLTLRLLGDVSGAFTGTFTLYNVTAATTDATLTATEAVPTTKSAVLALPAVATVYELRAAHNGTPVTDYATVSGAVIEVSWSV